MPMPPETSPWDKGSTVLLQPVLSSLGFVRYVTHAIALLATNFIFILQFTGKSPVFRPFSSQGVENPVDIVDNFP